jgi:hypothetical protein
MKMLKFKDFSFSLYINDSIAWKNRIKKGVINGFSDIP